MSTNDMANNLFAIVDLGSNSFNLILFSREDNNIRIVKQRRERVLLAHGLSKSNILSHQAMLKGWKGLNVFAPLLQHLPQDQVKVVATATLRNALNRQKFLSHASKILHHPIEVLSGLAEARLIYQGAQHNQISQSRQLVIDIGGASTEIIAGTGHQIDQLFSLNMGSALWLQRYFNQQQLTESSFNHAEKAANAILKPLISPLQNHGWDHCISASGIIRSLIEIAHLEFNQSRVDLPLLLEIKHRLIRAKTLKNLEFKGLHPKRKQVFPSALAIVISLYCLLRIDHITLSSGALREGLIFALLAQYDYIDDNNIE